ncbi:MAG: ATP synthase F1 subunit epsilon [Candidatus Magasanikbacteria bacterium RIFCSPHIGHO2_01_FULL_41_23]|uniref:ATP synthase epsilon chain n=1 Tax=Candidatus Magasanikbacteria bacterium RIFCSPLOWO2_01_FULL_40_15 TaxID=1798686 RepID=A0A1F6N2M6_9BACT|nr:MAG: ATP synthase F1 subunit epsilon [Candidatus Magasanikbacteria bacterium RIFCSPHIGHO2_01_FULL_41_23]OGH66962.1 MAG: ATP synthase F1 subunit epsilon [Candidatus Magasanikbacteria bacterium RIFCSPHIGHO2_02_FULL_41_35]OGH74943.1 MAG: ATP synthase F1 subunit epsilon [Candidatus Magasanikbacteria bacterium RIFCSPHIGHO2_12_FULL_41_16]OGH78245.1 MAG: ATP synthase F1 subunit epsilon [Candidatus Magasanikbacteria bacterium RIFCSPLOWO2_01_FULL_40_15]
MNFSLKIVSPDGPTFSGEVESVSLPTAMGEITVLSHHVPLIAVLASGEARIKQGNETIFLSVSSGVIEIRPDNTVYVLAETAERAEQIDLARAETAKLRAEELMKQRDRMDDEQFALVMAKMEKELARLRVGKKWRNVG